MKSIQKTNIESFDKLVKLKTSLMIPSSDIKGIVLFLHGINESKEKYYSYMEFFTKYEYVGVCFDQRNGENSFLNITSFVDDLAEVIKYINQRFKNKPIYIYACDFSTLVIRNYLGENDDKIKGVFLCNPLPKNHNLKTDMLVLKVVNLFLNDSKKSKILSKLTFKCFNQKLDFTVGGFKNLFNLYLNCYNPKIYKIKNKDLKIKFTFLEDSKLIGNMNLFNEQIEFLNNLGYNNISYKKLKNNQEILKDLLKFIIG